MTERVAKIYPPNALAGRTDLDVIDPARAPTIPAVFRERVRRTPDKCAYREYDHAAHKWCAYTWSEMAREVARWQTALEKENLPPGAHVALRLRNSRHWVIFDQAAQGLGLVVVPLYVDDRCDNVAYILENAEISLLLLEDEEQCSNLSQAARFPDRLHRVVVLGEVSGATDPKIVSAANWLPEESGELRSGECPPTGLATIVYTSGTTGRPKGVMLSQENLVSNTYGSLQSLPICPDDEFLSFLPLSHMLERTAGYHIALMAGAVTSFARSIPDLAKDLLTIRPTVIIAVPRIFERVYARINMQLQEGSALKRLLFSLAVEIGWARFEHRQGRAPWRPAFLLGPILDQLVGAKVRAKLGGRLKAAISGGAPLPPAVSRIFIALGIDILQGYGLTESSPVISVDTLEHNIPASIGLPLTGVEVRIGENDELLARGPNIMLGYWNNEEATREIIDEDGWLHTGDKARIENGYIYITGRLKEIIVLANGEKVPPADMESAIAEDALFEQTMVIGEGMPYLSVLVVLNHGIWREVARKLGINPDDQDALNRETVEQTLLERIGAQIRQFPGYAQIRRTSASFEPWSVEDGLLTPTMKLKRAKIEQKYQGMIERMYEGH